MDLFDFLKTWVYNKSVPRDSPQGLPWAVFFENCILQRHYVLTLLEKVFFVRVPYGLKKSVQYTMRFLWGTRGL
jgi:hypothetical protein